MATQMYLQLRERHDNTCTHIRVFAFVLVALVAPETDGHDNEAVRYRNVQLDLHSV